MLHYMKKLAPVVLLLATAPVASAGVVTLKSLDGETSLNGELIDYDGQNYTIKTIVGEMSVDALQVECQGESCPVITEVASSFGISGAPKAVDLFGDLLSEFGKDIGGSATVSQDADGATTVALKNELDSDLSNVTLSGQGTAQGFQDLSSGAAHLAISSRSANDSENAAFKSMKLGDLGSSGQQKIFALDGLVVVTSKTNPIRAVSETDLAKIFSGQITNWDQIGGPSAGINLYVRDQASGTGVVFNDLVMAPAKLEISGAARIVDTDAGVAKSVATDPLGIGIASISDVGNAKVLAIRGVCGIQVPATAFTIKTEEYPLTRRLYAYTTNQRSPAHMDNFIDFLDTKAAQNAIAGSGYVDLGVAYQTNDEQGLRYLSAIMPTDAEMTLPQLRTMTTNLMAADRLSITYRFALGSSRLDERATDDIVRLAKLLSTGDFDNKELLLIGFTDSIGNGAGNTNLSRRRALEVKDALQAALPSGEIDGLPVQVLGFGEVSPLACNDSPNGRRINRRVEVWLRDTVTVSR